MTNNFILIAEDFPAELCLVLTGYLDTYHHHRDHDHSQSSQFYLQRLSDELQCDPVHPASPPAPHYNLNSSSTLETVNKQQQ